MTVQTNARGWIGAMRKTRALAAGLLVAAMMAAGLLAAKPAHASTTFVVNETGDFKDTIIGDGFCGFGGACSLRAAIEEANFTPGADTIEFDIPGTGVKTMHVGATGLGDLPVITDQVTIDGYTQTGAHPNTRAVGNDAALKVQLDGTEAGTTGAFGLDLDRGSSNSVIRGLVINRFSSSGIDVFGVDSTGVRIRGNFIGTDPTGTLDRGNGGDGVDVFSQDISGTVVGGTTAADRNLISGNDGGGVEMGDVDFGDGPSESVRVQGNYIGTDRSGTKDLGNGLDGIFLEGASGATVGGKTAASRNVIGGNGGIGLELFQVSSSKVLGNRIGTTAGGKGVLGNDLEGVVISGFPIESNSFNALGDGTSGGSNTVAFNGGEGIHFFDGVANAVNRNSVFSNGGIGIDLSGGFEDQVGRTANDPGDLDSGPNGLQNKPVISSAKTSSTKTTITGKLASSPGADYLIQFYSNPSGDEGKRFLGQKLVTIDADGTTTFTFSPGAKVPAGQSITATATQRARVVAPSISTGDTSEFSAPKTVALSSGSVLAPDTLKVRGPSSITKNPAAYFEFDSPDPEVTFECSLDGGPYYVCSTPENVYGLSEGRHDFVVRAVDEGDNADPSPAAWAWTVDRNKG